jgi:flagellar FliL protein
MSSTTASQNPSRTWLMIGLISMVTAVIAALAVVYFALPVFSDRQASEADDTPDVVVEAPPVFLPLAPFTVNLESPRGNRLLYIGVTFKLADEDASRLVQSRLPELKSRMLLLLSGQNPQELTSQSGKLALQNTLRDELSRPYSEGGQPLAITGVLYNDFIVQ